jgi:hypothetical protein
MSWAIVGIIILVALFLWSKHNINSAARKQVKREIQQELDDYEHSHPNKQ